MHPRLIAVVLLVILLAAVPVAARASDPVPTTISLVQEPSYVYVGDQVTVTATVTPNPEGGELWFTFYADNAYPSEVVDLDPATGSAQLTLETPPDLTGSVTVDASFAGWEAYAPSTKDLMLDVRYLPGVALTAGPPAATRDGDAAFEFHTSHEGTVDCRLDQGSWMTCTSPWQVEGLLDGSHTAEFRAVNLDGRSRIGATHDWIVDRVAPTPGMPQLDGGAATSNRPDLLLSYPGTDSGSGISYVRVSRTGEADEDGHLLTGGGAFPIAIDTPWINGDSGTFYADLTLGSGPQTAWVQWIDAAGNWSEIRSATIDVRVARIRLAEGAWQTSSSAIPFAISGVQPSEVASIRISNANSFENGVLTEVLVAPVPPTTWSLTDDDFGGIAAEGMKMVYMQWKDSRDRWSNVVTTPIVYSSEGLPDVEVVGGPAVSSANVEVRHVVPGALLNGFPPLLQFSCNGQDWVGYWQPNSTITVNIERADAGCPAGDGQRTLRFRWSVNSDWSSEVTAPVEWSSTRALTINLTKDLVSPIASAPSVRIAASGSMSAGKAPLQVAWSGSDAGSGIARYEIARSIDGASWTPVSTTATSPSLSTHLSTGHEYRFRVRAIDKAGNVSAWATGSKFRLSGYSEASSRISYSGTWSVASSASYWGGKARYSKSAGARATFTFTGRSLAWIAAKGPTRGSARVYVNGTLVSTVNLNSSGISTARIVFTKSWSSSGTRTVQIRVTGTSGHPRVDVDGFLVGN